MTDTTQTTNAGAQPAPGLQPEALRIAMHLRQRAQLSRGGNLDTLSAAGANELERQHAELSTIQSEAKHWRTNHDNVVARLRIFTQRPDIPKELADRLPWYRELVRLQGVESQAAAKCLQQSAARTSAIAALDVWIKETGSVYWNSSWHGELASIVEAAFDAGCAAPPAPAAVTVQPLTPDEARRAARTADLMRGPSDTTQPAAYAMAGALALAAKLAAAPAQDVASSITIDFKQAAELLEMFGGEPAEITLMVGDGHSGNGLYASYTDMPEEGAGFLGTSDDEALPAAAAQVHATQLAGQGHWKEQGYASEAEYAADMQAVGEALMETIASNYASLQAADWDRPMDSPAEIVVDLLNLLDEAKAAAPAQAQEDARNLEAPESVEVIGYRISDPCEPDLGFWLSEETGAAWCKSEALTLAAPAAPAVDARAARNAAFEAVRNRLCGLQRYSFVLDDDGVVRRAQDRSGNWIEFDDAHELFDPVAVDAAIDAARAAQGGAA